MTSQLKLFEYMPQNKKLWDQIVQRYKLDEAAFDYAAWMFTGKFEHSR
jgi:hypothetical protein